MAGVKETATWETHIYQIEENDPVHGGEEGVTNKPIKHLANRTLYLRKLLTEAGQRIQPKKITGVSKNSVDLTGHTHEIESASTSVKGLVQLTNDTGLDSESLALTAKAGKSLAQSIAQAKLDATNGLNKKVDKTSISDAVNSTSQTTVASSRAVKTAYDKGVEAKNAADSANNNANSRVKRAGTYAQIEVDNASYAGLNIIRSGTSGRWDSRFEALPDRRWTFWNNSDGNGYQQFVKAENGTFAFLSDIASALKDYIPSSKKSNAVDSTSADTVATSRAVKLVYDRANIAAIDGDVVHLAKNEVITGEKTFHYNLKIRSNADNSKIGRVGQNSNDLFIQNGYSGKYLQLKNTGELRYHGNLIHDESMPYVKVAATDGAYAGIDISRSGKSGTWMSRIEALPDKRWKFHVQNSHDIYLPAKGGTVVLDTDVSNAGGANKVVKTDGSGDVIGRLFRATYQDETRIQGAIAFRVNNSNDNYTRYCNSPAAVRTWLGLHESAIRAANWSEVTNKPTLVQDIRLGATVQRKLGDAAWETHGAGYVVTGFHNVSADLNTNDYVYVKPIQKYINGAWVTIANA